MHTSDIKLSIHTCGTRERVVRACGVHVVRARAACTCGVCVVRAACTRACGVLLLLLLLRTAL